MWVIGTCEKCHKHGSVRRGTQLCPDCVDPPVADNEKRPTHGHKWMPILHAHYFGILKTVAEEHGYALALHGSLVRDLDLIAVAWTDDAKRPIELIKAMHKKLGSLVFPHAISGELKPHGREGYVIHTGGGAYIDVSVIPPTKYSCISGFVDFDIVDALICDFNMIYTSPAWGGDERTPEGWEQKEAALRKAFASTLAAGTKRGE